MSCLKRLWRDDAGVIISAEVVLILTIIVLGVIVGLVALRDAIVTEFHDIGLAISNLNQSYAFTGMAGCMKWGGWGRTSWTAGSWFVDTYDGLNVVTATDIVAQPSVAVAVGPTIAYTNAYPSVAVARVASYGTICLADGTLVPLTWVSSGTWALPSGTLLAATSANANTLRLADGTLIVFVFGRAGTLVYDDGKVVVVRPGANGTLLLADSTVVATLDTQDSTVAILSQGGVRVKFVALDLDSVLLADGTVVKVDAVQQSVIILNNGRSLKLHDAIVPRGLDLAPAATEIDTNCGGQPCHSRTGVAPVAPAPQVDPHLQPKQLPPAPAPVQPEAPKKKTGKAKKETVMVS